MVVYVIWRWKQARECPIFIDVDPVGRANLRWNMHTKSPLFRLG